MSHFVVWTKKCLNHSSKYLRLCSTEEKRKKEMMTEFPFLGELAYPFKSFKESMTGSDGNIYITGSDGCDIIYLNLYTCKCNESPH